MRATPFTIAFFSSTRKWGGVKTWSLDMGLALKRRGNRVWIVAQDDALVDRAASTGLSVRKVRFGPDGNPFAICRFLRFFRQQRVDYVVVNLSKEIRSAGVGARLMGIPLIHRIGAPEDLKDRLKTRLTQRLLAPRLLTCSDYARRELLHKIPLFRDYEIAAIHPGVLPGKPPGTVGNPRRIVLTSQLRPEKGHCHVLEALRELRQEERPFQCVIAGTGPCEEELRQQAKAFGIADVIKWAGFVQNVTSLLEEGDIFVLPSLSEPLGIALEEAMANGLVPVARRAGGVPEIWPPALEQFLFPPAENARGFASALKTIMQAPDERLLGWKRLAWEHAARAFHIEKQCDKLLAWLTAGGQGGALGANGPSFSTGPDSDGDRCRSCTDGTA